MRFLIVTHVLHKKEGNHLFAYGPYVKEINLWNRQVDEVVVVAPFITAKPNPIDLPYNHPNIKMVTVNQVCFTTPKQALVSLFRLPMIVYRVARQMAMADHIHLRCPGNMGLIGCFAQIFFPKKIKTAKYAANWDFKCKQPVSYRIQQNLIRNTLVTKNMTGLVYGVWPNRTRNIKPFFTASYTNAQKQPLHNKNLNGRLNLVFVGALSVNKQPLLSATICHELNKKGIDANLHIFGEGKERETLTAFIVANGMKEKITLHGNQPQCVLQEAYRQSHFLIFLSKSEGWPKAVAEAMWWGCLPVTSPVSCVPEMVGYGERGEIIEPSAEKVCDVIINYLKQPEFYRNKCRKAADWAREYTLERFDFEIQKIVHGEDPSNN